MRAKELLEALQSLPSELLLLPIVFLDETQGMPLTFQVNSVRPGKISKRKAPISYIALSEEKGGVKT